MDAWNRDMFWVVEYSPNHYVCELTPSYVPKVKTVVTNPLAAKRFGESEAKEVAEYLVFKNISTAKTVKVNANYNVESEVDV